VNVESALEGNAQLAEAVKLRVGAIRHTTILVRPFAAVDVHRILPVKPSLNVSYPAMNQSFRKSALGHLCELAVVQQVPGVC
jgi:hypothetical protein